MDSSKRWILYCHTHIESGRRYIGLTSRTMERRWSDHLIQAKRSKGGRWHFPNAIRKHGSQAFSHEVLEICYSLEVANLAEECWIEFFDTRNPEKGFNLMRGGAHIPHLQKNPWDRPEYRTKVIARWADPIMRAKVISAMTIATNTPEIRAKRSETRKLQWQDPEFRAKATLSNKRGSQFTREKMSLVQSEVNSRPEVIEKHSISSKKLWSDLDYVAKMQSLKSLNSEAAKKRWEDPEYRSKFVAHNETHKICQVHGNIPLVDCYVRNRRSHISYECRKCYRERNNEANARRRALTR